MSLKTIYTVETKDKTYENVEYFKDLDNGFMRIEHYPNEQILTEDVLVSIKAKVKQIPIEKVIEIKEREIRA